MEDEEYDYEYNEAYIEYVNTEVSAINNK